MTVLTGIARPLAVIAAFRADCARGGKAKAETAEAIGQASDAVRDTAGKA